MASEVSLLCLQELVTLPCPEPDESTPHPIQLKPTSVLGPILSYTLTSLMFLVVKTFYMNTE
jgi:hypothetical protein